MSFRSGDGWRDVHLAAAARGVSVAGDFLAATALVLALQERGAGGYAVAAVLLASTVPMIVMAPVGGRLADRFDSRLLLTTVGLAQAGCCAAMAFTDHTATLVALTAMLSAGLAISQPTFGALVPDMVGPAGLPKAMAVTQTASAIGMVAGPAAAGFLVEAYGLRVPLLIDAATYLAITAAGLALRTRRGGTKRTAEPAATLPAGAAQEWRLRSDRLLATLVPATAVIIGSLSMVNVVIVFFVRETLHASAAAYGLVDAVWTATIIVGAWAVARMAGSDAGLALAMAGCLTTTSLVVLAAAGVPAVGWLVGLYAVGGLCNGAENAIANLLIARRVPAAVRGRAMGTFVGVVNAAVAVGFLAAGPVLQVLTPRQALAAAAICGLLAVGAFGVPLAKAARHEPAPAGEPQPVAASA